MKMGEVVVSEMEAVKIERRREEEQEEDGGGASSTEVVRWESYLPRTVLRVLLVEADDSTRQIITALLRKCNYRGTDSNFSLSGFQILH